MAGKPQPRVPTEADGVYQIRFRLCELSPAIWRRILIRSDQTLADLHYTIQITLNWNDDHLHRFRIHGRSCGIFQAGGIWYGGDARHVALSEFCFRRHERFSYEYDFTDRWRIEVRLEERLAVDEKQMYPVCIGGKRAGPPQDCGVVERFLVLKQHYSPAYMLGRMADAVLYPDDIEDWRAWCDDIRAFRYWVRVDKFDRRLANRRLKQYVQGDEAWRDIE
jgi:hypothetical protein